MKNDESSQGSIELAVKEAKERAEYFRSEANRMATEANKHERVASQLQTALGILTGKNRAETGEKRKLGRPAGMKDSKPRRLTGKGTAPWADKIGQYMTEPVSRRDLRKILVAKAGIVDTSAYGVISNLIKEGAMFEDNGMLHLSKWTEPQSKAS